MSRGNYPDPIYKKRKLRHLVWLIPLAVAAGSGLYAKEFLNSRGPLIAIRVSSAEGIKADDTPVVHHGVEIGKVVGIALTEDKRKAVIHVRLQKPETAFAKEGAVFWVVRPEVSGTNLQGLTTLFSGPYIDAAPGKGDSKTEFLALSRPPKDTAEGLKLLVHAPKIEHVQEDSPVYYRGVQVGVVESVGLGENADRVEARLLIWKRFSALPRRGSKFWAVKGFDVKGGIFTGLQLELRSLKTLVAGGIGFATPDKDMGPPVKDGTDYVLEAESKDEWQNWTPKIPVGPAAPSEEQGPSRGPIRPLSEMAGKSGSR